MARRRTKFEKCPEKRRKLEAKLIRRFNGVPICGYCGERIAEDQVTLDHIVPVSRGGTDRQDNMILSCISCNQKKGEEEWEPKYKKLTDLPKDKRPSRNDMPPRSLGTLGDIWPKF